MATPDAEVFEYQETQTATTNEFGLYTLQIGDGEKITGTLDKVNWAGGNKYVQVAIDPKGGTNYELAGTSQLLSVPYALYANEAKSSGSRTRSGGVVTAPGTTGIGNRVPKFNGTANTLTNSRIMDNGTRIGIGTTSPAYETSLVAPGDNTVEIKTNTATNFSRLRFHSDGASPSNSLIFTKLGASTPGTYVGLPRANMSAVINSGTDPSDFVFVSNRNFAIGTYVGGTTTLERMRVNPDGLVGISNSAPQAGFTCLKFFYNRI